MKYLPNQDKDLARGSVSHAQKNLVSLILI